LERLVSELSHAWKNLSSSSASSRPMQAAGWFAFRKQLKEKKTFLRPIAARQ
jgi:hypothetical protein